MDWSAMKVFLVHQQSKKKLRVKNEFVIGRMEGNKTYPDDGRLSRSHCILRFEKDVLTVEDLGSKNGTQIADMTIDARTPIELVEGDLLTAGDQTFEILFKGKPKEFPDSEPDGLVKVASGEENYPSPIGETVLEEAEPISVPDLNLQSPNDDLSRTEITTDNLPRAGAVANEDLSRTEVAAGDLSRTEVVPDEMEKTVVDGNTGVHAESEISLSGLPMADESSLVKQNPELISAEPQKEHSPGGIDESLLDPLKFNQENPDPEDVSAGPIDPPNPPKREQNSNPTKAKKKTKAREKEKLVQLEEEDEDENEEVDTDSSPSFLEKALLGLAAARIKSKAKAKARLEAKAEAKANSKRTKKARESSRINIPTPRKDSSEEVVYARMEKPSFLKTFLLLLLYMGAGPAYILGDPVKLKLIQDLRSPVEITLWAVLLLLPAFAIGLPLQTVRMRTGWTKGVRSFYLSAMALAAIVLCQVVASQLLEKQTGFDKRFYSAKVRAICIDAYKPAQCAQVVFQCPECIQEYSYKDRKEFLESIYPTVEALTLEDPGATADRVPAAKGKSPKQKPKKASPPSAKTPPPKPPEERKPAANRPGKDSPSQPETPAEGEYPAPTILPEKDI